MLLDKAPMKFRMVEFENCIWRHIQGLCVSQWNTCIFLDT